jgi:hypothetical protein
MYCHADKKLVYLAHPRTASVATAWELCRIGFVKVVPGDHHSKISHSSPAKPFDDRTRREWTAFTAVRNHWDAAVSWRFKRKSLRSDDSRWDADSWRLLLGSINWVEKKKLWWLHGDDADQILYYEDLESQLIDFLLRHGIELNELSEQNVTPSRDGRHYSEFFTNSGRDYVGERFRDEIERFGYEF